MQKLFFRNLVFIVALNVLIKPLWILGIDRTVQNVVGSSAYGLYFVLFNLSMLTQILLDAGISNYNNRHLARDESELTDYLSNIFSIKIVLSAIYMLVTLFSGFVLQFSSYELYLLSVIGINQALASLIVYSRSNISALHHFKVDSMISVMDKALMILICGILLIVPSMRAQFSIEYFIYAQTMAYLITLLSALGYIIHVSGRFRFHFSLQFAGGLFKRSMPFALLILMMAVYSRIDGIMIERLLPEKGAHEAGIYASAYRLLDALNQFGYLFSVLLLPIFSRMLAKQQSIESLARASFTVIFIFAFICCMALSFFSVPLMHLLYHDATGYSSSVLSILIYSFPGTATVYIFGTLLTANGNLKALILISLIAVVLNFCLNLALIPMKQALGAAMAACITGLTIGMLNFLLAARVFHFRTNVALLLKLFLFITGSYLLFMTAAMWNIHWMYVMVLLSILSLGFATLLGLIEIRKIIPLLKTASD
ncbi:MAG: polysaccharide biosynthesis C-terminal domain-containing protein [Chitinophagales bacterium]|nr:polysaccharide biosynthesis C-terminal domain-containing protein [Chitinophagales bacterium]